jgi:CBS domain-containing protein
VKVELGFDRAQILGRPLPRASRRCPLGEIARHLRQPVGEGLGGCVLIQDRSDGGRPVGLVTAADVLAVVGDLGWENQPVDSLPLAVPETVSLEELEDPSALLLLMADRQVERLLVVDLQGQPVAIVTLADAAFALAAGLVPILNQQRLSHIQLRTSAETMRTTLEALPDVVLILDARGDRLDLVPTRPALGEDGREAEVVSQMIASFVADGATSPWLTPVREALALGRPVQFEYALEVEGEPLAFVANIAPMTDDTAVWVARDVTAIKAAEQATQSAKADLESWVLALEQREGERSQLLSMGALLRNLASVAEFEALVPTMLEPILGDGLLWIGPLVGLGARSLRLEWGAGAGGWEPDGCWVLGGAGGLSGRSPDGLTLAESDGAACCSINRDAPRRSHCIPLRDRGQTVGVLRIEGANDDGKAHFWPSESFLELLGERLLLTFMLLQLLEERSDPRSP